MTRVWMLTDKVSKRELEELSKDSVYGTPDVMTEWVTIDGYEVLMPSDTADNSGDTKAVSQAIIGIDSEDAGSYHSTIGNWYEVQYSTTGDIELISLQP